MEATFRFFLGQLNARQGQRWVYLSGRDWGCDRLNTGRQAGFLEDGGALPTLYMP